MCVCSLIDIPQKKRKSNKNKTIFYFYQCAKSETRLILAETEGSIISARTVRPGVKRAESVKANEASRVYIAQSAPGWRLYNTPDDFEQRPPFDDDF